MPNPSPYIRELMIAEILKEDRKNCRNMQFSGFWVEQTQKDISVHRTHMAHQFGR